MNIEIFFKRSRNPIGERGLLTTNNARSSHGVPVVVDSTGEPVDDVDPLSVVISGGPVLAPSSWFDDGAPSHSFYDLALLISAYADAYSEYEVA
jgi:hypothetical protein